MDSRAQKEINILFVVNEIFLFAGHLGIMSLSGILKQAGYHNIDIVVAEYAKIKNKLEKNRFTLLAYSTCSDMSVYYLELNRRIKERFKVFSVFGGPHPTLVPEMIEEPGVDGVCIGEGDYALLDLVNNLAESKPVINIANWWIKQDGRIFRNPVRPLIKDLDGLPFVDRTLWDSYLLNIITSRGCPYRCSFCIERGEFRRRRPDSVIEEIKRAKYGSKYRLVHFSDSTFNISLAWLEEFSLRYKREIGLPFFCLIRPDLATNESIKCLKEAGCFSIGMSIETANDYLRNEILKKGISKEQILSAARIIKKHKIRLETFNMIGIPLGSLEDDLATLKLNISCRPSYAAVNIHRTYKRSDMHNFLLNNPKLYQEVVSKNNYTEFNAYAFFNSAEIKKLQYLFNLTVNIPLLFPALPFLLKLPLRYFYLLVYLFWKTYCQNFRIFDRSSWGWLRRTEVLPELKAYWKKLKSLLKA